MRETTTWMLRSVRKEGVKHTRTAIPLQFLVTRKDESQQPLAIYGGVESCLEPMDDPMLEQGTDPITVCDSKVNSC